MGKAPAYQWYVPDWRKDPRVLGLTFISKAVWREALDAMFLDGNRGELVGTVEQLARICTCSVEQFEAFLAENASLNTADVTECDGIVTLRNRRMYREAQERERIRLAMAEGRARAKALQESNEVLLECDDTSSSSSSSSKKEYVVSEHFEEWYKKYPRKGDKKDAFNCYKARLKDGHSPGDLLRARDNYIARLRRDGTESKYVKMAKTFLGPGGHIEENLQPLPPSCGSCRRGDPASPKYCAIAMREVQPDDKPCDKHKEAV